MFGLGMPELLVIAGVLVLLFGPSRLPKMGKAMGDTLREFRKVGKELKDIQEGHDD